jgi:hypothetical protein
MHCVVYVIGERMKEREGKKEKVREFGFGIKI